MECCCIKMELAKHATFCSTFIVIKDVLHATLCCKSLSVHNLVIKFNENEGRVCHNV